MKLLRQQLIMEIINEIPIITQEDLANALRAKGIHATQATLSRDIKDLQLVKTPVGGTLTGMPSRRADSPTRPGSMTACAASFRRLSSNTISAGTWS